MKKQLEKQFGMVGIAAVLSLAGLIIYLVTSMTGYLAASAVNFLPVASTAAAIVLMILVVALRQKLSGFVVDIVMLVSAALVLYSFYEFVLGRVSLAADVYFIPVNYPASEATTLHISIVGIVLYVLADIAMIIAAFMKRSEEREERQNA